MVARANKMLSGKRAALLAALFMSAAMLLVLWRHMYNQSKGDSLRLIADHSDNRPH